MAAATCPGLAPISDAMAAAMRSTSVASCVLLLMRYSPDVIEPRTIVKRGRVRHVHGSGATLLHSVSSRCRAFRSVWLAGARCCPDRKLILDGLHLNHRNELMVVTCTAKGTGR